MGSSTYVVIAFIGNQMLTVLSVTDDQGRGNVYRRAGISYNVMSYNSSTNVEVWYVDNMQWNITPYPNTVTISITFNAIPLIAWVNTLNLKNAYVATSLDQVTTVALPPLAGGGESVELTPPAIILPANSEGKTDAYQFMVAVAYAPVSTNGVQLFAGADTDQVQNTNPQAVSDGWMTAIVVEIEPPTTPGGTIMQVSGTTNVDDAGNWYAAVLSLTVRPNTGVALYQSPFNASLEALYLGDTGVLESTPHVVHSSGERRGSVVATAVVSPPRNKEQQQPQEQPKKKRGLLQRLLHPMSGTAKKQQAAWASKKSKSGEKK
jgi:hypothetical protein